MSRLIIYPGQDGRIFTVDCCQMPDEMQLAHLAVPEGTPFRFIDSSDLPEDDTYRTAWRADFSEPDGYGLSPQSYAETYQK